MTNIVEISLEAQGALPNFRYDIIQPLIQGRVEVEGVKLRSAGPTASAGMFTDQRFKDGDFGLLDANWGDLLPAIDAGWDLVLLPVFIKRKPVYNYLWVRADRGIEKPKDLEGKSFASVGYTSAISTYTRGFLHHHWGVNLHTLRWRLAGPGAFEIHDQAVRIDYADGPRKSTTARLLDGEVDASTGDITDAKAWEALESSPLVKRMFSNYQAENEKLLREHKILTPVHVIAMGGKLHRRHPELARRLYDAFDRSRQLAYEDALGDGSGYSLTLGNRELLRDQLATLGDVWNHGLSANQNTVETFLDYNYEQGVTRSRLSLDQVFAAETLDT
jgi:4,5-dihydroxyphthalate decarboxylase